MRRPRVTIQRQMVAIAVLAIVLVTVIEIGRELHRRWQVCRGFATAHAAYSQHCRRLAGNGGKDQSEWQARAIAEQQLSRQYSLAWVFPWRLYTMVE